MGLYNHTPGDGSSSVEYRGLCSTQRQNELKQILGERKIEIFGVLEIKMWLDNFLSFRQSMEDEWEIVDNREANNNNNGQDSI